jgi:hypothetical protein
MMLSIQRLTGEVDLANTARKTAKNKDEAKAADQAWADLKMAEIHAKLALKWQKIAAGDRQASAQRATAGSRSMVARGAGGLRGAQEAAGELLLSQQELDRLVEEARRIAKRHEDAAQKFADKGEEEQVKVNQQRSDQPKVARPRR